MTQIHKMIPLLEWFKSGMLERLSLPRNVAKDDWQDKSAEHYIERAQQKLDSAKSYHSATNQLKALADTANLLMMAAGITARATGQIDL